MLEMKSKLQEWTKVMMTKRRWISIKSLTSNMGRVASGRYNLRERKRRDYSHLFLDMATNNCDEGQLATPQMNMKQGFKVFGEEGIKAVRQEMQQLHDQKVMKVTKPMDLTPKQRQEALVYLMYLKRKRCGEIKGRGWCADRWKQRAYTAKEVATSPTVATEAVFLTAVIDALEERDVAVFDVPGAFMQADMDELVHARWLNF